MDISGFFGKSFGGGVGLCACGAAAGVDGARFWRVPTKLVGVCACGYLLSSVTGGEGDFFFFATRLCDLAVVRGDGAIGRGCVFSPGFLLFSLLSGCFFSFFLALGPSRRRRRR